MILMINKRSFVLLIFLNINTLLNIKYLSCTDGSIALNSFGAPANVNTLEYSNREIQSSVPSKIFKNDAKNVLLFKALFAVINIVAISFIVLKCTKLLKPTLNLKKSRRLSDGGSNGVCNSAFVGDDDTSNGEEADNQNGGDVMLELSNLGTYSGDGEERRGGDGRHQDSLIQTGISTNSTQQQQPSETHPSNCLEWVRYKWVTSSTRTRVLFVIAALLAILILISILYLNFLRDSYIHPEISPV